jgi:MoxR-like ATPase
MAEGFSRDFQRLTANMEVAIKGKTDVIQLVLACFLSEGHLLIEDVPGVGKTSVARALAASIDGEWRRIQFTPDLLPSDVTGVTIYNQPDHRFEFHPGGVFANIVLADEINRASPKTQSALLEVMEERRVTVDAKPYDVPRPFIVVATQNPIEMDGTYRLPEAQLDRFLMRISVGYPDASAERTILAGHHQGSLVDQLRPVLSLARVEAMVAEVAQVHVSEPLADYIIALTAATRNLPEARLGASPRGSIALMRASRAWAAASGRDYVVPEDVKALASCVLAHRLILQPEAELRGTTAAELIDRVLATVPVPHAAATV